MSDKAYVGRDGLFDLETSLKLDKFTKVIVHAGTTTNDDGEEVQLVYEAGDESGRTLEVQCPLLTYKDGQTIEQAGQALAADILARVQGYQYQPFIASGAILDPAAELGDGVTVAGTYSVLASHSFDFDPLSATDISAPTDGDVDHEYPYESRADRNIIRKINRSGARLKVDIDSIVAEVQGVRDDIGEINTSLSVMNGQIQSRITSSQAETLINQGLENITISAVAGENQSTVTISANGIDVDSAVVKFSNIVANTIKANASVESPTITGGVLSGTTLNSEGISASGNVYKTTIANGNMILYWNDLEVGRITNGVGEGYVDFYTSAGFILRIRSSAYLELQARYGLVLDSSMYGNTLPTIGNVPGRVYFLI